MTFIEISVAVVALAFVVIAWFLVPTILEVRRTCVALRETLERTSAELQPTFRDLQQAAADLRVVTDSVAGRVEDVEVFIAAVGDAGRNIRTINTIVGSVTSLAGKSSVWMTGAKVATSYLMERLLKRKRG
jgi:uncharacterized protein YoxC